MSEKIYIGNLSYKAEDEDLRTLFSQCGEIVEAKVVTERETGRSRGFGFVTFASSSEAKKALELDGQDLLGRNLNVKLAENKQKTGERTRY